MHRSTSGSGMSHDGTTDKLLNHSRNCWSISHAFITSDWSNRCSIDHYHWSSPTHLLLFFSHFTETFMCTSHIILSSDHIPMIFKKKKNFFKSHPLFADSDLAVSECVQILCILFYQWIFWSPNHVIQASLVLIENIGEVPPSLP